MRWRLTCAAMDGGWSFVIIKLFLNFYIMLIGVHCSALLSANIKTLQIAECEKEDLVIKCPSKTTIHVQFANFGRLVSSRDRPCHLASKGTAISRSNSSMEPYNINEESRECLGLGSKQKVVAMCQDKRSCRIPVNVETFKQDPCPRTWKYLEVAYKCKPNVFLDDVVCEGDHVTLECETPNQRIAIQSAMFGRDRSSVGNAMCPDKNNDRDSPSDANSHIECMSSFATEMAMTKCQNERVCTLSADEATFGNQCPIGTRKYLSISYACVPHKLLISQSGKQTKESSRFEEKNEDYLTQDQEDDLLAARQPQISGDIQAIEPEDAAEFPIPVAGRGKTASKHSDGSPLTRCNCTEYVSFLLGLVESYQKITKNKTLCLVYVGCAAGIGLLLILLVLAIHFLMARCRKKAHQNPQTISASQSASKLANPKGKDQRMPLYSTRYAEENEEAESLQQPVDLTNRYAPRSTLPRAVSLTADPKKSLDSSRSLHRLTTDGSFYS